MLAIFLGYRARNPKYGFPIEALEGSHKKLDFSLKHAEKAEFCNKPDTWITPGILYILYITAGLRVELNNDLKKKRERVNDLIKSVTNTQGTKNNISN